MNKVEMSKFIHKMYDDVATYTIRIYSNNTKQEIYMIINSSIYVIVILFNCSHHVHVILKNPSRYKTGSKDHDTDHRRHRRCRH